ncbi:hypothetical protein HRbin30_01449 [bacterium HR30]|nr:hypothetical protein HRbin30_01449 [bacterium HR30]
MSHATKGNAARGVNRLRGRGHKKGAANVHRLPRLAGVTANAVQGVPGLYTESAQPMRSWPYWFQTGFLPLTIWESL